ncbi:MAG: PD40 domain-containing protein, partial [Bacteroidia bacterium]|nr:PD40 domain-containing protein [Bacteroidia bacterium]
MPIPHGNLIIPFPGDSAKYILFHQTGDYSMPGLVPSKVYYTVVDMNLDGGLGGVPSNQKNLTAISDTLSAGMAACKHANGRDWWVIAIKDSINLLYKILVTPTGITSVTSQSFNFPLAYYNASQPTFSPDGKKFAYTNLWTGAFGFHDVRLFSFDNCTGMFDSLSFINIPQEPGFGIAFSPNSKFLYHSSFTKIYQLNTDTSDIPASNTVVATYDGYISGDPPNCCATDFWLMYLAANGRIYISSGSGVVDMHFINYPDSAGLACDVQQHALPLPCFSVRGNVNHPNYYLGCDTTLGCTPCYTNVDELSPPDFKFRVYPNPVNDGILNIGYLLPQNKHGIFE